MPVSAYKTNSFKAAAIILLSAIVSGAGSSGIAQELSSVNQSPYYKFSSVIPNAIMTSDGSLADVTVQYYANSSGDIDVLGIATHRDTNSSLASFPSEFDSKLSDCVCFDRQPPYSGQACFGSGCGGSGPLGPVLAPGLPLLVTIEPQINNVGDVLDFSLTVQQAGLDQFHQTTVAGFTIDADGNSKLQSLDK